ncbi:M10 family metallopeptidase C-terminal domain-containing protein [Ruegeria pomeroyi]|uniref:M10 family metallopeptidase C-terminal domain-containing protein n=1 Tax=Ruegeria pomeroyi TaxID=89184 RepID=A0A9Q3ZPI7_9RHOB|nr:M10 family metallopeptidase C-terminal domain-containing protein [Ruegeria pomeroyi]MCE8540238.1 M10 family metallopeptidase C-terminal domain-containing protein [Ruegeria pomeroyi]
MAGAEGLNGATHTLLGAVASQFTRSGVVEYSFAPALQPVDNPESFPGGSSVTRAWTAAEKASFRAVTENLMAVANITLRETSNAASADINLQIVQAVPGGFSGYAGGTVFVVESADASLLTHELSHSFGLGHPFDTGFNTLTLPGVTSVSSPGDFGFNSIYYTVMSYQQGEIREFPNVNVALPTSLMVLDIAALQSMYGANTTHKAGNDVYDIPSELITIWDADGTDVIDFSASTGPAVIDLRAATLRTEAGGLGWASLSDISTSARNVGGYMIAYGVTIENGIGGRGDDQLTGNGVANRLEGGAGNDTLTGGGGDDTLVGGSGTDIAHLEVASTEIQIESTDAGLIVVSSEGRDLVHRDVEQVRFSDQTISFSVLQAQSQPEPPITGTDAGENLPGTSAAERIDAGGGADWITPGGGNDTIDGGDGNDMVSFIDLPDTPGRTNLQFRLDVDLEAGTARSHDGSEQMQLSNVERVTGTIYADYIRGDAGANHLRGAGDYDWFVVTTGNDTLDGGTGQDMITFVEWQNTGPNAISDAFSADGAPPTGAQATGVLVDLANPANNTNLASGLTLISIERVTGSGRQDVFYGDGNSNDFRGLGDYDWFVGSAGGRERYFGGDGVDTVTYFMSGEGVTASLRNGARVNGEETGYGSRGDAARDLYFEIENLVGTRFDDRLTGNSGRNQLSGLEGDDFLFGYEDVDYLKGGAGNDTIDGGTGSDYALFDGDRADYTLTRTADNAVTVTGPDGTDSLINVEYFRFDDEDVRIWDLAI